MSLARCCRGDANGDELGSRTGGAERRIEHRIVAERQLDGSPLHPGECRTHKNEKADKTTHRVPGQAENELTVWPQADGRRFAGFYRYFLQFDVHACFAQYIGDMI